MEAVKNIEKNLEKSFKDLPHLPESTREGIAKIWPWLALIGGILQLLAGVALYHLANYANNLNDLVNSLYVTTQKVGPSNHAIRASLGKVLYFATKKQLYSFPRKISQ